MNWQFTPLVIPLLASVVLAAGLAYYFWKRHPAIGAIPLTALMVAVAVWSLGEALRLVSVGLPAKFFWTRVRYLGIVCVPVTWLTFVLQYLGRDKWLTPRNVALLAVEPAIVLALVWTNDAHHLMWREVLLDASGSWPVLQTSHGVAYWGHAAYSYLLLAIGILLLVGVLFRAPRLYSVQLVILLGSALLSLGVNVLCVVGLNSLPLDLTPLAFTLSGLALVWDALRFRLFDIIPVARSAVVDSMNDGMLVLDAENRVVDINPAAQEMIGRSASDAVGRPVEQVLADRPGLIDHCRDATRACGEIALGEGRGQRNYELNISPLHDQQGRFSGRLILLHDITERKRAETGLIAQKQLFESLVAMARATSKLPSLEATLQSAINMAATLTGAEHGSMILLDGTGAVTHCVLARGKTTRAQEYEILQDVMDEGLAGWVVRHRQPALVYDTRQDERWVDLPGTPPTRSVISIPIVSGSAVLGVLTLAHTERSYFTTEHTYLIQSAADQMVLALRNAQMYDEQRRLADRQTKLYQALRAVGEHLDPETIAHAAVEAVARLTGWAGVAILLPDEEEDQLIVQAGAGALSAGAGQRIPVDQGVAGRAFRTVQVQHAPDASADPDYVEYASTLSSELALPLRRGERVLGVLDVAGDRPTTFNEDEILLSRSMAEAIALALDNARLYAEIQRYAADLGALYEVARSISRSLVLRDVLAETLQSALTSLGFDAGLVTLADPSNKHLYVAAEQGLPPEISKRMQQESLERTFCAYVYDTGEAVRIGDIETETALIDELEQELPLAVAEMRSQGMRAYAGIPLRHQERPLGTLSLFSREPRTLSTEDQGLQMAIGQQIATAVTNAQLFQAVASERSRLQALIESSRDGIILIGMKQRVLVVNAPALEFLHLTGQPEDWVNRTIQDILAVLEHHAPSTVHTIQNEIRRIRRGDEAPGEGENEIPPRAIHWLNLPVMADQTPLGRLLVLRDVTEERLVERMREDLVHAMVHDLRNPLTVISGALAFLEEDMVDTLPPSHFELWEIAQKSTKGMLKLVKAILEMSRLESRQMPLEQTVVSLPRLIVDTLESQLPLAAEKNLHLESDVPDDLPLAWADEQLIERVLQNLIGNAIKFTPRDGLVRVSAKIDPADQSRFIVSVSDTGTGISPEIQERLFQKFVTGQREGHGSGLGLAFCKMVLEAHGERIWVDSTGPDGTTFAFTLPTPPALES